MFNSIYHHLINNNLISTKQSGFIKEDSTTNQLLSITNMIHNAFDCDIPKEVRSVYLDISKAFDKVWHDGLIYKLKQNGIQGKLLQLIENFLSNRVQRTSINGKLSSWKPIVAGVPQGSVLGPVLFLVFINDLIHGMKSDARIFADDTSLFVIVDDPLVAHDILMHDLNLVEIWANQWRMSFNPDPSKPPIEVIFSTKSEPPYHPSLTFGGSIVQRSIEHKHIGLILDKSLSFHSHIKQAITKASQGIGVMKFMSAYAPRFTLEQIFKSYVRPHLEYGDIIFHQTPMETDETTNEKQICPLSTEHINDLMMKLESIQYQAALSITGGWKGTNRTKLYGELGWEWLSQRRWHRRMSAFHNIVYKTSPSYLTDLLRFRTLGRGNIDPLCPIFARTEKSKMSFFPACSFSWNKLINHDLRIIDDVAQFKARILKYIRPKKQETYGVSDRIGLRYLTQLRLDLCCLKFYKFEHNFNDTPNNTCSAGDGIENKEHFLLDCQLFVAQRRTLLDNVSRIIGTNIGSFSRDKIEHILLYGDNAFKRTVNKGILIETINFIKSTKRFDKESQ